jgi:hypothetical protein
MRRARTCRWLRMRPYRVLLRGQGVFFAAQSSADCITSMAGFDLRQAHPWNFRPYSTTIFDFIRRAMPFQMPRSLTDAEVYALTAYILAENKLIGASDTMDAQSLPKVKMPNRDNFIIRFLDRI